MLFRFSILYTRTLTRTRFSSSSPSPPSPSLGVNAKWLDQVLGVQSNSNAKYKTLLIERLLQIVHISGQLCKYHWHFVPCCQQTSIYFIRVLIFCSEPHSTDHIGIGIEAVCTFCGRWKPFVQAHRCPAQIHSGCSQSQHGCAAQFLQIRRHFLGFIWRRIQWNDQIQFECGIFVHGFDDFVAAHRNTAHWHRIHEATAMRWSWKGSTRHPRVLFAAPIVPANELRRRNRIAADQLQHVHQCR